MLFSFQDNYFEEAFKMRNVLEEFLKSHHGQRRPTILGLREHIFTGRFAFEFILIRVRDIQLLIRVLICPFNDC